DLVLLEDQDRTRWDHAEIAEGLSLVARALRYDPETWVTVRPGTWVTRRHGVEDRPGGTESGVGGPHGAWAHPGDGAERSVRGQPQDGLQVASPVCRRGPRRPRRCVATPPDPSGGPAGGGAGGAHRAPGALSAVWTEEAAPRLRHGARRRHGAGREHDRDAA